MFKRIRFSRYDMDDREEEQKDHSERAKKGTRDQVNGIIKALESNIVSLKREYDTIDKMPSPLNHRMLAGVSRNLRDRQEDLNEYNALRHNYITRGLM